LDPFGIVEIGTGYGRRSRSSAKENSKKAHKFQYLREMIGFMCNKLRGKGRALGGIRGGASAARHRGSSPLLRTNPKKSIRYEKANRFRLAFFFVTVAVL
jgi:hypothetical protein